MDVARCLVQKEVDEQSTEAEKFCMDLKNMSYS